MPLSVILADDHAIVRQGLAALLAAEPDIAILDQVADGERAWESIRERRPDVAILDLAMPKATGIEVVRRVKGAALDTHCLLLTMHDEPAVAQEALRAGAAGFVVKDDAFDELLLAVRSVAAGGTYVSPNLASVLRALRRSGQSPAPLSPRELEIVRLLAAGKSSKEIARILSIGHRTVDTHRYRLMEKLGVRSVKEVVGYAIRHGIAD